MSSRFSQNPVLLLLAALAAAGAFFGGGVWLVPLLFGGAALPLVLRGSPVEPSLLKLGLYAALLSPPLYALLRLGLGSQAAALWVLAGLEALGIGERCRIERVGRAGWYAIAIAAGAGLFAALVLLCGGWAPRLGSDAHVWNAVAAEAFGRAPGLENPLLPGTPFPAHPGYAFLLATLAEALHLHPAQVAALISVWALVTLPLAVMLIAAPLWGEVRRVSLAPLLVLALPLGLWGLGAGGGVDPLFEGGAEAAALALSAGALLAAVHGLRHGRRPWTMLCVLSVGATACLVPALGFTLALVCAAVALLWPGGEGVRLRFPAPLVAASLPALWLARRYGFAPLPWSVPSTLVPYLALAPLLFFAALGLGDRARLGGREGRTLIALLTLMGLAPLALGFWGAGAAGARLASLALSPLAAGGMVRLLERRRWAPLIGLVLVAGVFDLALRGRARVLEALAPFQVHRVEGLLEPVFPSAEELPGDGLLPGNILVPSSQRERARLIRRRHRALAYRWIRLHAGDLGEGAVLWRSLAPADIDRGKGPVGLSLAPLYTGLPLWCENGPETSAGSPRWKPRRARVRALYETQGEFDPNTLRELSQLARPAFFLVEEADREATYRGPYRPFRGVDLELERLGAERAFVVGTAAVYTWSPR